MQRLTTAVKDGPISLTFRINVMVMITCINQMMSGQGHDTLR